MAAWSLVLGPILLAMIEKMLIDYTYILSVYMVRHIVIIAYIDSQ